jgi:hypothetical protein
VSGRLRSVSGEDPIPLSHTARVSWSGMDTRRVPHAPASATRPPSRWSTIARVAGLIVVLLVFFESAARIALSSPAFRERIQNDDSDVWWRLHWLRVHRHRTDIYYTFDQYDAIRGWAVRPNVHELPAFPHGIVNSNSQGVRGRREYASPKPAGLTRMLVFGDSFTFGDEVSDDETYAADLERMLPGVEVINLGVHGYGQDQMLLYLRQVVAQYEPDLVLLGFVFLDMQRNELAFRDFAKPRFDLVQGRLVLRNEPVPNPTWVRLQGRFGSRFLDLATLLHDDLAIARGARRVEEYERLTTAILDAFRQTVLDAGATPVFLYLPVGGELGWPDLGMIGEERFFVRYCTEHGVASLDLRPSFMRWAATGAPLATSGHWRPFDHRIAAEALALFLRGRLTNFGHASG